MGLKAVTNETREQVKKMILAGHGSTEIIRATGTSRGFVCSVARRLGVRLPRPGVKRPTPTTTLACDCCGKDFERPVRVIRGEQTRRGADRLGQFCSQRCFRQRQGWSRRDLATLRKLQPTHSNAEIAHVIGRTPQSVAQMLSTLGLRRDNSIPRLIQKLRKEAKNAAKKRTT